MYDNIVLHKQLQRCDRSTRTAPTVLTMQTKNFTLRLPHLKLRALHQASADDELAIDQYINVAVAEKLACRLTAAQFLQARAQDGSAQRALKILMKSWTDAAEF